MNEKESLNGNLFPEKDSIKEIAALLDKVIEEIASEAPEKKISMIAIFDGYNKKNIDPALKIDANDASILEIISAKLKQIEHTESAEFIDGQISDIKSREATTGNEETKEKSFKNSYSGNFSTYSEKSMPKENE